MSQKILMLNRSAYIDSGLPDDFSIDTTPCTNLYTSDYQAPETIQKMISASLNAELVVHRGISGFGGISPEKLPRINYISPGSINSTLCLMDYAPVPSSAYKVLHRYYSGDDITAGHFDIDVGSLFSYEEYDNKYIYAIVTKRNVFSVNNYAVSELVKVNKQDASSNSIHSMKLASVQNIWEPLQGTHNVLANSSISFYLSNGNCYTKMQWSNTELQKILDNRLSSQWMTFSWIGIADPNDYPYKGIFGGGVTSPAIYHSFKEVA